MTEANTHAAENQISKQGSNVVVRHQPIQCYFRPETEELVFIADSHADEFENHWQGMANRVNEFHLAKEAYSKTLETYALAFSANAQSPLKTDASDHEVTAAETKLEAEREALREKLGQFSTEGMSYDDVVELIPVAGQGMKKKRGAKPTRYAYVKKSYISTSQDGRKLHTVSLKGSDKKNGENSIYRTDKNGNRRIDGDKLREQLTTLEWPKIKLDLAKIILWSGLDIDPEALNEDYSLFEWAESWNNSLLSKTTLGDSIDVSAGAQFMRYISNVGASAEFDPAKGNAAFKGEAKASLTIASGMIILDAFVPDRLGWSLAYTNEKGTAFDMGKLRLHVTSELGGFIGASVQVEGQLQVVTQGDQQLLAGQPGGRLPRFKERKTKGAAFHNQMAAEDEGLNLSGQGFVGSRVEFRLKGGLQWLKPTAPKDLDAKAGGLLASSGQFTNFCTIGYNIGSLRGVGAGGKFHCTFINGKFCFHVAASLCWGVGAKGGVICEVETHTIVEFGAWLVYQLYRLDYSFFDVVSRDAFKTYGRYCVMQMADIENNIYEVYGKTRQEIDDVGEKFKGFIKGVVDENKKNLDASRRRNQLATNTIARREDLLCYTPEAKGILLYLLTRHGVWDHLDLKNRGNGLIPDIYKDRKEAVIWVLRSIQTRAEWRKVLCRMTSDGASLASDDNELSVVEQQKQHLVNFLQEGFNRDQDLHKAMGELVAIYDRLRSEVAWGYALAMNDTTYYQLNNGRNTQYPQRCTFGPCEDQPSYLA